MAVRGAGEQRWWNLEAERFGGFEIDDQLEFGRLHHRQVGRLVALENAAGIHAGLTISVGKAGSVAHQPADGSELAHIINCWQRMPRRQLNNSVAVAKQHGIGPYENAIDTLLGEACEGRVDVALAARIHNPKF